MPDGGNVAAEGPVGLAALDERFQGRAGRGVALAQLVVGVLPLSMDYLASAAGATSKLNIIPLSVCSAMWQ